MNMLGIPVLPRLSAEEMSAVAQDAARGVRVLVRRNFAALASASSSRAFWREAAGATDIEPIQGAEGAQRGMAAVVVRKRGVRLHWLGGDIRATGQRSEVTGKPTKALLIPFKDSPLRKQRKTLAEMHYPEEQLHVLKSRNGCPLLVAEKRLKTRTNLIWLGKLVKKAHFEPRPEVMPTPEAMSQEAASAARQAVNVIMNNKP